MKRERDLGNEVALVLCVFGVSPPALTHFAVKEHACLAAKIDVTVSGGYGFATKSFCFSHFFFSVSLFSSMTCLGRPRRGMQVMLHIFPFPFFIVLISLSPMLLLLQSQVASRVRAGFVEAHAFWRDTVTDLIAKRKRQAVREMEIRSNTV